jgi:hypothetical protein
MATKLTAQLDAVSTCHRHRITPHTAAMLHPLTAAVPFTMLRQLAMPQPSPCYAPLPGEHAVHGATQDAARCGDRRRVLQLHDRPFLTPTIHRCLPRFWSRRGVPSSPVCTYGLELRHIKRRGGGCSCCTRGGEPVHDKAAICEQKTSGFASQR